MEEIENIRPIYELLQLVKDELERGKNGEHTSKYSGLCEIMKFLNNEGMITGLEKRDLLIYFDARLPKGIYSFNWEPHLIAPRIEWLNTHIELTEQEL